MSSSHQASVHTDTDESDACGDFRHAKARSGVSLNNAQQSVIAETINNAQGVNFVSSGTAGGSDGLTQSISARNVDIRGDVNYQATNYFQGNEDLTIREWLLSFPNLNFEAMQFRNLEIAGKAPGTGQWLLESRAFLDWTHGRHGEARKLWCYGIPGAGKTILASIVIDYLQTGYSFRKNIACIYVYFDYKDQKTQDLKSLLPTLLAQLVRNTDRFVQEVKDMHRVWKSRGMCLNSDEYLLMLKSQAKSFERVFIVVDALDECLNDTETNTLDHFLKALHQLPANVHLLFTSRNDPSIGQKVKTNLEIEIKASDDDIRIYFESQIKSVEHLRRLVCQGEKRDKSFRDNLLGAVVANSKGMFLLAQLHLKYLASKHGLKDLESGVGSLPQTPDGVYETALIRMKEQDDFKQRLAINTLAWLVFAERALSIAELRHALAVQVSGDHFLDDDFEIEDLTSACAGIVVVDQGTDVISLAHHTAETYLRKNESKIFEDAQSKMAETCLTYLLSHLKFSQVPPTTKEVDECCKRLPFVTYAANHWGNHLAAGVRGWVYKLAWKFLSDGQMLNSAVQVMTDFRSRNEVGVSGLHIAAYFGLDNLVKKVIDKDKNLELNARTQRRETALHWAAIYHQRPFLKLLIDHGADLNMQDIQGRTALHRAVMNGDGSSVALLLSSRRLDLKLEDSGGWTSLRWAAAYGYIKVTGLLLEGGAEVDAADKNGWTALRWAAQRGHKRVVELLIRNHAALETSSGDDQWTLLRWAASEGRDPIIQLLIEKKVDLNAVDTNGWSPLRWAIDYGHGTVAWLLIKARADVNRPDGKGFTPLHSAVERWRESRDKSLVWLLLESKADINARTKLDQTALHIASSRGHQSIVWLLLEKGAEIHARTKHGLTALHLASSGGHTSIVMMLLEKGAEVNTLTKHNLTALHLASSGGHGSTIMLLLEKGANPSQLDNNKRTALHCAVTEGHGAVAQLLIQKAKSLIHAVDDEKRTVLHVAASAGDLAIVTLLLDSDAEIDVRDREGYTPLHRAVSQQHESVVFLLLERGASVRISNKKRLTVLESAACAGGITIAEAINRSLRQSYPISRYMGYDR